MNNRQRLVLGASVALISSLGVTAPAQAASYDMVVPKRNKTVYSAPQTKVVEDLAGDLHSRSVGGNYVVDAGMSAARSNLLVKWQRDVTDNDNRSLKNIWGSGASVHLAVSSDFTTLVDVRVTGTWDKH